MVFDWNNRTLRSASPQHERYWQQHVRPLVLLSAILHGGMERRQHKTAMVASLRARPLCYTRIGTFTCI